MTTAIDTNVLVAFLDISSTAPDELQAALEQAFAHGPLVISAPVYAELLSFRGRTEHRLDKFLEDIGVSVEWQLDESTWRLAGLAFQDFATRRREHGSESPRHILTDFLIGAHALVNGCTLLTLDQRHYRAAFPKLKLQKI